MKLYLSLAGWIALCLGAGGLGSLATAPKIPTWYAALEKPPGNPPSWVFGPVWTTLYVMMGVAAWLVWRRPPGEARSLALRMFAVQLLLNTLWSFLFFGLESPGAAFLEIVCLWVAIVATAALFRHVSPVAGWLLVPYGAWVAFASYLNLALWRLNR